MGQRNCVCFHVSLDYNQFAGSLLLPSKFSWLAIAVAFLLTALLLFVVVGIRDPATSSTLSNILQTAIVLWAAFCSLPVARRSSGYLRQLWILFAAMLFLVSAAQALETYLTGRDLGDKKPFALPPPRPELAPVYRELGQSVKSDRHDAWVAIQAKASAETLWKAFAPR